MRLGIEITRYGKGYSVVIFREDARIPYVAMTGPDLPEIMERVGRANLWTVLAAKADDLR